jgi:hypothetical protein
VVSFGHAPSADGFPKRYELHYQLKKMDVDGAVVQVQFGCVNFHLKHYEGDGAKLTLAIKNKRFAGWTQALFHFEVPLLRSPIRGKCVFALCSSMIPLDFLTEPSFECVDDDSSNVGFIHAADLIDGRDTIEEYLVYGMFRLLANFGFAEIAYGETPVSKMVLPLPRFPLARLQGESNDLFWQGWNLA